MADGDARYGLVRRGLHWTVAVLMVCLLGLGWYLAESSYFDRWYASCLEWHKALGMLALLAGMSYVLWAIVSRAPAPLPSLAAWERLAARGVHLTLFVMMVAIPLTGYLVSTSAGDGIWIFGLFEVPAALSKNDRLRDLAIELHFYLAYATAALVMLHAAAACKHHFLDGDGSLKRML